MKQKTFLFAAFAAAFLSVASFSAAQVTIGGGNPPKAGTILDLNSTTKGGLLLSNVYLTALDEIPATFPNAGAIDKQALAGMIVFNRFDYLEPYGDGLYVWDGSKWNYIGGSDGILAYTTVSAPTCTPAVPAVSFLNYNLGADIAELNKLYPDLSPAKQQIAYLATCTYSETDATVFGDLYQWGRVKDGHEKRNSELFSGPINASTDVDVNGQPKAEKGQGKFITDAIVSLDWCTPTNNSLWGNGQNTDYEFTADDAGAVKGSNDKYYQKPVKTVNDPCPSGWRVPTQDEWERLGNYGCGTPQTEGGTVTEGATMPATGQATTSRGTGNELTWIPVKGGKVTNDGWGNSQGNLGGFAVYKTTEWEAAIASGYFNDVSDWTATSKNLYDAAAPEPLLFLPAAGQRDAAGSLDYIGFAGRYKVSSIYFDSYNGNTLASSVDFIGIDNVYPNGFIEHVLGTSVRCVK
ncbi:MAG: fibrobacter succinogenes major paralogous domain-containing protein [Prevotellaceae bacterium]|jgi:uncharacterized protein (TIGR02145 family)|nr:fibrobacter succinogenes major paralogous domain-containing protein [Prevotellaceae bacterium]